MPDRDPDHGANSRRSTDSLIPLVYSELRKLARARLRDDQAGQSINATGLVHEAFIRLSSSDSCKWNSRGHFFAAAAEAMRRIMIERARQRQTKKRGNGAIKQELDVDHAAAWNRDSRLIQLDEVLSQLEAADPRKADVVKLRFFVGLSNDEIADALDIHVATVARDWAYSRAWLKRQIDE